MIMQKPLKKTPLMRAVSAMPFDGRSYVRAYYMSGVRAVIGRDAEKVSTMASELDLWADNHRNIARRTGIMTLANVFVATQVEGPISAFPAAAAVLGGIAMMADFSVSYTQRKLAEDIKARAEDAGLNLVEPNKDMYADTKSQSILGRGKAMLTAPFKISQPNPSVYSAAIDKACQPTKLENRVTRMRGHLDILSTAAFATPLIIDTYNHLPLAGK